MCAAAGSGSQKDLMLLDECILVDKADRVIGHASKADAHRFGSVTQPEGLLHRAFSVFLFDEEGACGVPGFSSPSINSASSMVGVSK